jgi:membrane-anchored mycosin MYCP
VSWLRAGLCALALSAVPVVTGMGPADAVAVPDCTASSATDVPQLSDRRSKPLDQLDIADAQQLASSSGGGPPGSGVTVVVVDSGIAPHDQVTVAAAHSVHTGSAVVHTSDYHGTAVAGLIAGRSRPGGGMVGIAPGARIVDVQVYGWAEGSTGRPAQASRTDLVAGLEWLADQARMLSVDIAVVPVAVEPDASLAVAVRRLRARGVLVIAPSGNRPDLSQGGPLAAYATDRPGQDGFADIGPANEPGVLVAGTTAAGNLPVENPGSIPNHAVDVVVPTAGGISVAPNGGTCVLTAPATSWAAAEVGGVAALLLQRYAGESPAQIAARIIDTASGTIAESTQPPGGSSTGRAATSRYFGAGVVQPVDALTRPLTSAGDGFRSLRAQPEQTPPVRPPVARTDALHDMRRLAVWVGLVGGASIVVASILRPLLSRRAPS